MWDAALTLDVLGTSFGKPGGSLGAGAMVLRAMVVYLAGLALVRLAAKRLLGRLTAFDAVVGVLIGSVLGRAVNGSAPFGPTLIACAALTILHRLTAVTAFHFDGFGTIVKGRPRALIRRGEIQWTGMKKSHLTERDLLEMVRLRAHSTKISDVEEAWLERNGDVSVILRCADRGSLASEER